MKKFIVEIVAKDEDRFGGARFTFGTRESAEKFVSTLDQDEVVLVSMKEV